MRQTRPVRRHELVRIHTANDDRVFVCASVTHHTDTLNRKQDRKQLGSFAIQASRTALPPVRLVVAASRSTSSFGFVTSPRHRTAEPGPGNGCGQTIESGKTEITPQLTHFILK
jgi:hypothetical protein